MSDLISRSALIEAIGKLKFQVNNSEEVGHNRPFIDIANVLSCINEQPTAYDVEKVVAELEYQKEHFEKDRTYWADHTWKDNVVYCNWDLSDKKVNCYESAIDIVKAGWVE